MDSRTQTLNASLKRIDSKLFAKREASGAIHLYRKPEWCGAGSSESSFVMALTHDWTASGKSVEWGIEVIQARLKAMDLYREGAFEELLESYEKAEESKKREFSNNVESFLRDFRREFARSTDHINTALLAKTDKRREVEKRIHI